ncbi:hypothetical protein BDK51DRAFT_28216, partial [Blyttiomyces helicus]
MAKGKRCRLIVFPLASSADDRNVNSKSYLGIAVCSQQSPRYTIHYVVNRIQDSAASPASAPSKAADGTAVALKYITELGTNLTGQVKDYDSLIQNFGDGNGLRQAITTDLYNLSTQTTAPWVEATMLGPLSNTMNDSAFECVSNENIAGKNRAEIPRPPPGFQAPPRALHLTPVSTAGTLPGQAQKGYPNATLLSIQVIRVSKSISFFTFVWMDRSTDGLTHWQMFELGGLQG